VKSVTIAINDIFEFDGQPAPAQRPAAAAFVVVARRQYLFQRRSAQIDIGEKTVTATSSRDSSKAQGEAARAANGASRNGRFWKTN